MFNFFPLSIKTTAKVQHLIQNSKLINSKLFLSLIYHLSFVIYHLGQSPLPPLRTVEGTDSAEVIDVPNLTDDIGIISLSIGRCKFQLGSVTNHLSLLFP